MENPQPHHSLDYILYHKKENGFEDHVQNQKENGFGQFEEFHDWMNTHHPNTVTKEGYCNKCLWCVGITG